MYRPRSGHRRLYELVDDDTVDVYDFDMAAYMLFLNFAFVSIYRDRKEYVVTYKIPSDFSFERFVEQWLNSESSRFASCQRQLRKAEVVIKNGR